MKKILVLVLALLMGIGCFASCTKKDDQKPVPTTATQETDNTPLPKADYRGQTYTILYRDSYAYEWDNEDATNGDTVNDAIYHRNSAVEERYGILLDLETGKVSGTSFEDDFLAKVTQVAMSGDDLYQLAAGYTYRLATNSAYGSFLNLFNVPNLDLTAEWWDGDFTEAASYKGVSYIANGPLSLSNMYSSACIYFNRNMLDQNIQGGTDQVFSLVDEGNWTLEDLKPYFAHVAENFGFDRMVWGSDWPVCTLGGGLSTWVGATHALLSGVSLDEKARVLSRNALKLWSI